VTSLLLIHHAANRGHGYPPSSMRGLQACLEAGARVVEVDVQPLADGDFALLHDDRLENTTDGDGPVCIATSAQVQRLRLRWHGQLIDEPVALLSQAVAAIGAWPQLEELQLDLKAHVPLTDRVLGHLLERVAPVQARVRVTSVADWAQRRLRVLAPGLALGFDPQLYLDVEEGGPRDEGVPPLRVGAYGYYDDHPLAVRVWGAPRDYLAARAEALLAQAPAMGIWTIRALLITRMLDDGFDWIAYLHAQGAQVAAWTLDAGEPAHAELARRLLEAGVDRITTNDAPALACSLDGASLSLSY
jgi:glycerophosphoryl diester phosphodiesterase